MYITRETDYAIRCILFLSREPSRIASASEISRSMHIPRSFLAKILRRLSRNGLLKSTQGVRGGVQLSKKPGRITLLEVIEAVQGTSALNLCAIDRRLCNLSGTCAVHPVWAKLSRVIERKLRRENFGQLVRKE